MSLAKRQRAALCDLFDEVGPFAETLCGDWQTQDLAAHLWVRENKPSALPGIGLERFAGLTERVQTEALHEMGFPELVRRLRKPGWVMRPADRFVNAAEWTIHHMDVLKPQGRALRISDDDQLGLWRMVSLLSRSAKYDGRLVLEAKGKRMERGTGSSSVHVLGEPSELLYFFSGRVDDADLTIVGEPDQIQALKDSISGL